MLFASAYLVAGNWFVYVWATDNGQITETSLRILHPPAGQRVRRPRLSATGSAGRRAVALAVGAAGVVYMTVSLGELPWVSLTLAVTFALYGIVRKVVPVDGVVGLSVETALLTPTALVFLVIWAQSGVLTFGHDDRELDGLIAVSGLVTTLPLICFAQAVRKVSLVTIGVIQYMSPTLSLVVAVLVYGEPFEVKHQISFGLIWIGLAIYVADAVRVAARQRTEPAHEPVPEPIDGGVPLTDSQLVRRVSSPPSPLRGGGPGGRGLSRAAASSNLSPQPPSPKRRGGLQKAPRSPASTPSLPPSASRRCPSSAPCAAAARLPWAIIHRSNPPGFTTSTSGPQHAQVAVPVGVVVLVQAP